VVGNVDLLPALGRDRLTRQQLDESRPQLELEQKCDADAALHETHHLEPERPGARAIKRVGRKKSRREIRRQPHH
jgi:hypothetical protein